MLCCFCVSGCSLRSSQPIVPIQDHEIGCNFSEFNDFLVDRVIVNLVKLYLPPNSPRGFTSDATSSHPHIFGRLLLSSVVFCLFWASANGGSVAAQAPAITSATVGKNVVTGMPGAPKRYQIYASATVSNLPNSVQSVDLVYFFQKRTRASTANPVSPAGPWLRLSLLQNPDDDPANSAAAIGGTANASTDNYYFTPDAVFEYRVLIRASFVDVATQIRTTLADKESDPIPVVLPVP